MLTVAHHGGSLRVWLAKRGVTEPTAAVGALLIDEAEAGLESLAAYADFQSRAETAKNALLEFLLQAKRSGQRVLGYGAAAKGNTLLNYAASKLTYYQLWQIVLSVSRARCCQAAISRD